MAASSSDGGFDGSVGVDGLGAGPSMDRADRLAVRHGTGVPVDVLAVDSRHQVTLGGTAVRRNPGAVWDGAERRLHDTQRFVPARRVADRRGPSTWLGRIVGRTLCFSENVMHAPPMFIGLTAMPVSAAATDALNDGNIWAAILQLGIGGVFVVFGAAIYRRFENRADETTTLHKEELAALELKLMERHKADVEALRAEALRFQTLYLDLLKEKKNAE